MEQRPVRLSPDRQEMVSKRLSVVLRHDKGEFQLRFDERALVPLDDVLQLPIMRKKKIDRDQIMAAIFYNDKQRFRAVIKAGRTFIGASQGHSFKVNPESVHTRASAAEMPSLVHGTRYDFLQSIFQHGIRPGGLREGHRQMVHCLPDEPASAKFYPPGVDVVLHISPQKSDATWYRSENGYYMTSDVVPAKAIEMVSVIGIPDVVLAEGGRPPDLKAVAKLALRVQSKGSRASAPSASTAERAYMTAPPAFCCCSYANTRLIIKPNQSYHDHCCQDLPLLVHINCSVPRMPEKSKVRMPYATQGYRQCKQRRQGVFTIMQISLMFSL